MEALNKNKEEIEKILKGCGSYNHTSEMCGTPYKNNYFDAHKGHLYLCPRCKERLQERIKTSILWCEDEIQLKQLKNHLNWLKSLQEKKQ